MAKHTLILTVLVLLTFSACTEKKSPLKGIWKMQEIEINGSKLEFEDLGMPYIEFNNKGGYLLSMSGIDEKGSYTFKDKKLTLSSSIKDKKPQTLTVEKIDSNEIRYYSQTEQNRMNAWLVRDRIKEIQLAKESDEKD